MIYDGDPASTRGIDMRIIDFAHCVTPQEVRLHRRNPDQCPCSFPPRHQGPDYGYLLGLKSLVSYFESIYISHGGDPAFVTLENRHVFDDLNDH
jgi:hypothetical protein